MSSVLEYYLGILIYAFRSMHSVLGYNEIQFWDTILGYNEIQFYHTILEILICVFRSMHSDLCLHLSYHPGIQIHVFYPSIQIYHIILTYKSMSSIPASKSMSSSNIQFWDTILGYNSGIQFYVFSSMHSSLCLQIMAY